MSVQLEFVGHACFRLWQDGRPAILMDPFHAEPLHLPSAPQLEAETVIVSSLTDPAHDNYKMAPSEARLINALDVARGNTEASINGSPLITVAAGEAPDHTLHSPMDNALYAFKADGLWFMHMGDLGYGLTDAQLEPFAGHCDVFLVLAGEANTPKCAELSAMIDFLKPRWVVPMHYELPPVMFSASPVETFLAHRANDPVVLPRHHTVSFPMPEVQAGRPTIVVLDPSGYKRTQPTW